MFLKDKIKELRIKNNLTQAELGDKLYVSDKTVSSWESGRTLPDINILLEMCSIFDINISTLVSDINERNLEIELKIKVNESEFNRLLNIIKSTSKFIKEENQDATYYKLSHRDMINEWLRIRKEGSNYILNYKKKNNDDLIEEYEVTIDSINNLKAIFNNIDLKESIRVNKHRIAYLYNDKYEFSFDNVEKLGLYLEIELKKQEYTNEEEIERLINLVKELSININDIETRRYPELIENLNK